MFQFSGFPSIHYFIRVKILCLQHSEFPHSEICGSKCICHSPQLIAACHVLHRRLMPRHPPYALCSLIVFLRNAVVNVLCAHVSEVFCVGRNRQPKHLTTTQKVCQRFFCIFQKKFSTFFGVLFRLCSALF